MVRKASSLKDIVNVFHPKALTEEEEQNKFYQPTAAVRDGRSREFHDDLFDRIRISENNSHLLVVGHGGCGKSTELRMLARKLSNAGMSPIIIEARDDMNMNDFSFIDISMLIVEHLAKYAENENCEVDEKIISSFKMAISTKTTNEFWDESVNIGSDTSASGSINLIFLKFMSKIGLSLKMGSGLREELRREVGPKESDIIGTVNTFIDDINSKILSKRKDSNTTKGDCSNIVIIIDGLEKCRHERVQRLFDEKASSLTEINTHMVIACPINVYHSSTAGGLQSLFTLRLMPMIKTHNPDRNLSPYQEGIDVVEQLILKRVDASFFEDGVLTKIIKKCGGSLRDAFHLLSESAFEAYDKEIVDKASVDFVLNSFSIDIFRRVKSEYYKTIKDIYEGDHEVRNSADLYELLYAGAVFEYNGIGWIDLHPLIRDYIDGHPKALK